MTQLPEPISIIGSLTNDERPQAKALHILVYELIKKFNQLLAYLQEKESN